MAGSYLAKQEPTITSHRTSSLPQTAPERFWIPFDFRRRRWCPAKLRGHSVSSALPCISFHKRAEGTAGTFQRGKFPNQNFIRKRISLQLRCKPCAQSRQNPAAHSKLGCTRGTKLL